MVSKKRQTASVDGWSRVGTECKPKYTLALSDPELVVRVELSDGMVLNGDKMPILKMLTTWNWKEQMYSEAQARVADAALNVMESVAARKLSMEDAAVLMHRVIQDHEVDGMLVWRLMLVGYAARSRAAGKPGKPKPRKQSTQEQRDEKYLLSLFDKNLSNSIIARDMALKGRRGAKTPQGVGKARKRLKPK